MGKSKDNEKTLVKNKNRETILVKKIIRETILGKNNIVKWSQSKKEATSDKEKTLI